MLKMFATLYAEQKRRTVGWEEEREERPRIRDSDTAI